MVDDKNGSVSNDSSAFGDATSEDTSATPTPAMTLRDTSINILVPPTERLSRGLLFVKWLLVIPAVVVLAFYGIAVTVTTFFAFWAILFVGRYPKGLFIFARDYMALWTRTAAYFPLLLTDDYPIGRWRQGAIRYDVDYPDRLSRLRVLLKMLSFLLYTVSILLYLPLLVLSLATVVAWFGILFTGAYPARLFRFMVSLFQWIARVQGWQYLMRDEWSLFATTRAVAIPVGIGAIVSASLGVFILVVSLTLSPSTLEVGDCFDFEISSITGQVTGLNAVSCEGSHDAEVYATATYSSGVGTPFPGQEALVNDAYLQCLPQFEGFVGRSYEESVLDIFVLVPDALSWTSINDRTALCSVFRLDLEPLRGSASGSGL